MILNRKNLNNIENSVVPIPEASIFSLPEKVLQFGTGVLLRGLPEYFIDKANRAGIFNGRVAVVKSTTKGTIDSFEAQDSLYTIGIRGIESGQKIEENIIVSAVSRVIDAHTAWNTILEIARSEHLDIVISNTTEVGIQLTDDDIYASPPSSFPGKLLSVLYERFKHFNGDESRGLVILPTELVSENGAVLKKVVITLARQNGLAENFLQWLESANSFCNTLVDRIVPGKPDEVTLSTLNEELGYTDDLLIIAEVYRLWAIEGDEKIRQVLSFEQSDAGVIVTPDISMFKELKLRLLNGSHTLTCGVAICAGFKTVHSAMIDEQFPEFITALLREELSNAIPYPVAADDTLQFSADVLDRFRNPFIKHYWLSISANYTLKLKLRVVPVLLRYHEKYNHVPEYMSFGFAAYLLFMRSEEREGQFYGLSHEEIYKIDDENAGYFANLWLSASSTMDIVFNTLSNTKLWETDLSLLPGFVDSVKEHLDLIQKIGAVEGMKKINSKRMQFDEEK